eukprot:scaffold203746_cov30-Tisochrysis_lutea.AAC.1
MSPSAFVSARSSASPLPKRVAHVRAMSAESMRRPSSLCSTERKWRAAAARETKDAMCTVGGDSAGASTLGSALTSSKRGAPSWRQPTRSSASSAAPAPMPASNAMPALGILSASGTSGKKWRISAHGAHATIAPERKIATRDTCGRAQKDI